MEGSEVMHELQAMLQDNSYRTLPGYSIDSETYPDNNVPFIESHVNYLRKHPQVNPAHYLSNLRLMLKIR
jgi:hypothetical protein